MSAIAVREDLSTRTALSKSALTVADLCAHKAWHEIHHRRAIIPNPDMTFGSAVDAAVEQLLMASRAGLPRETVRPLEAAAEIIERNGIEIPMPEVEAAITAFERDILPAHDWTHCGLQVHLSTVMEGWGEVDGHPDIVLASGAIWDVKTSRRKKDTARTVELGFYALVREATTGEPVPEVGYLAWIRNVRPYWQTIATPVTDDLRAWTRERVDAYVRAKRADALLNRAATEPTNWTFPGGPRSGGLCRICQYSPIYGGPCRIAVMEGDDD